MALLLTLTAAAPISSSLSSSRSPPNTFFGEPLLHHRSSSLSLSAATTRPTPSVYCGRGDKKTAKGKRFKHSFGNARPHDKEKGRGPPRVAAPPSPPRKDKFDDGEIIKIEIDESLF